MTPLRSYSWAPVLVLTLLLFAGCPLVSAPKLVVTPQAGTFSVGERYLELTIRNDGGGVLEWRLEELSRASEDAPYEVNNVSWLIPEATSGRVTTVATLRLEANRVGLPVGLTNNAAVRIIAGADSVVVPIALFVQPRLQVSPNSRNLLMGTSNTEFTIINNGDAETAWTLRFLPDPSNTANDTAFPADFVFPEGATGVLGAGESILVPVQWGSGRTDFGILATSPVGSDVLRVRFTPLFADLTVTPNPIVLYRNVGSDNPEEQPTTSIGIRNVSAQEYSWNLRVAVVADDTATAPISVSASTGTTGPGQTTQVEMQITDVTTIQVGSGAYLLELNVPSTGGALRVPIVVEVTTLPVIAVSEPPQASSTRPEIIDLNLLDFGLTQLQATFWIANIGPRSSDLFFSVRHSEENVENPVIADISPATGNANGDDQDFFIPGTNILVDGVPVTVTIDRSRLTEALTTRTITVQAVDPLTGNVITAVDPVEIDVRIERAPLQIEGATNRSRPPSVLRFVFLLRDTLGRAIPTLTAEDRERLTFFISENDQPLDLNETNRFITGPEDLKVNLVLMLDFTGSMYNAGTEDPTNPLAPGEAIEQVRAAAKDFIDDLPPSYRVAIMYYHKRQQPNRVLHSFSTDRASLKAALDAFSLPPAEHRQSDVFDALTQAVGVLAAEDGAELLPFDEADIRSVVFVTDGRDNASLADAGSVVDAARDNRVRLYPLGYGDNINSADLITLAGETGGHLYDVGNVRNLARVLGNDFGLALSAGTSSPAANRATFVVGNTGTENLSWTASVLEGGPWVSAASIVPAQGVVLPGGAMTVTVTFDSTQIPVNSGAEALIGITSANGEGTVRFTVDVGASNATASSIGIETTDEPGRLWNELQNQIVLTYLTPSQTGGDYNIRVSYEQDDGTTVSGSFEEDAVFIDGTDIAGQISMTTAGITLNPGAADPAGRATAEVYVRTDYVPTGVTFLRLRFFLAPASGEGTPTGAAAVFNANAQMHAEIAPEGLLTGDAAGVGWSLLEEGDGIYVLLTTEDNPLPTGAFGNLLRLTVTGLQDYIDLYAGTSFNPEFFVGMRVDNGALVKPAGPGRPSQTVYFLYPGGPTNPTRRLKVGATSDLAAPALDLFTLAFPGIDPESPFAWDRDEDGIADFNDPFPDDESLPAVLTSPNPFQITLNVGATDIPPQSLTIRNNRLDSFAIQEVTYIIPSDDPEWITQISYGPLQSPTPPGPLAPGASTTINLHVNVSGMPADFYPAELRISTDNVGQETVPVTLVLND